jgi:hypothetical protein
MSNLQSLLSNQTVIASGSTTFLPDSDQVILFWNIQGPITGSSPTLQFSMSEVDPSNLTTVVGQVIYGRTVTTSIADQLQLTLRNSAALLISWTVTGSSPSFGGVNLSIASSNVGVVSVVSGSGGSGSNGFVTQGSATAGESGPLIQGAVTTSAPTYTTANTNPLSLTTSGALRTDSSATTQPISGTVTANAGSGTFTVGGAVTSNIGTTNGLALDATVSGLQVSQGSTTSGEKGSLIQGAVTTSSPSYTTAQTSPLSLTTSGALRTDASATTQPVSGTVTANAGSGTFTVSGTVTSNIGTTNGLALDASVTGLQVSQGSTTSGEKGPLIQGAVTTSAPAYTTAQTSPLSLTTVGNLRVDGSSVTQPVSGTVTANQGGTWTVQPGNTANTTPWLATINQGGNSANVTGSNALKVDGSAITQPVSGTITANIGTTNGLALDTSVNGVLVSQGSTTSGEKGPLIQGAVTTAAPSYTTAQTSPLSLTTVGNLRVDGSSVTQPVSGTITANAGSGTFTVSGTVTSNIGTTNGLALDATVAKLTVAQSAALGSNTQALIGGSVTTAAPTYTTGNINPLSLNTAGGLRVDGSGVTQPVSGTITANIGTSGSLALDTSVNGVLVAQGSTTTGEKGPLIQGAVTTAAPTYTTAQTSPLSLTTVGNLRVDGSSVTQPVSGTITSNQGTANTLANKWPVQVTDGTNTLPTGDAVARAIFHKLTDGSNTQAVKAASTLPVAADPASVVSISPNSIAVTDRAAITAGAQQAAIIAGVDGFNLARIARVGEYGTQRITSEVLLWHDAFEGATVNAFWTQSTTTQTIAQATGVLTLNNSNITTLSTDAIITSIRQAPKYPRNPIYARFRANITANVAANHTLVELGFGAPSGVTAVINNGAFFRWRVDGTLAVVLSYNGTEQVTQVLAQGVISTTNYYDYDIIIDDDFARFIVSNASGTPVVDTQVSITLTVPFTLAVSHIPTFARTYVDATGGGTAIQCKISAHTVQVIDGQMTKPWEQQLVSVMRHASINPTSYVSTPNLANGTAPSTQTPSNTASAYTTLGGEYAAAATAASENILSVFGFTIPSPYTFYLRGIYIPLPVVQGTAVVTTPLLQWFIAPNASSTNLSTATGLQRIALPGMMNTASTVTAGTFFLGQSISWIPNTPIACLPGTVLHIGYKSITGAATVSLVYRGSVYVDGFFE